MEQLVTVCHGLDLAKLSPTMSRVTLSPKFVTGYFFGYDIVLSFSSSMYQELVIHILIDNYKSQMGFRLQ